MFEGRGWRSGLVAGLLMASCTGHAGLSASLSKVCPGGAVELSWKTDGRTHLQLQPTPPGVETGSVKRKGKLTFHPTVDTTATLTVKRIFSHPVNAQWSIDVLQAQGDPIMLTASFDDAAFEPSCANGVLGATGKVSGFDAPMHAGLVSAHPQATRVLSVRHGAITAEVGPGSTSDAFASAVVNGDWRLETKLADGETCDSATLPRSLTITIQPSCAAGAAP